MRKYTKEEFLQAAELGEVSMIDAKHIVSLLDEAKILDRKQNQPSCLGAVSRSLQPDVAKKILKARDAFVEKDYDEVWHWLYSIASPNYDKTEPWEDLERMAGRL